jgi:molybdopterin synthase catalytic subunit
MPPLIAVTTEPLEINALIRLVSAGGGHGAIATFVGVVRDHNLNRRVTHLEYEAYEPLAVKGMEQIFAEAAREWSGVFEGGDVWIEGATANPEDEAARLEAVRRACA